MPKQPGPGYWSIDPILAGWLPPSQFISEYRLGNAPGVIWQITSGEARKHNLGMLYDGSFAFIEGEELVGIEPSSGEVRWRYLLDRNIAAGTLGVNGEMIYLADRVGVLAAYMIPEEDWTAGELEALLPVWQVDLGQRGFPSLMPLPPGGVLFSIGGKLYAVSSSGELKWESENLPQIHAWEVDGEGLVFTTDEDFPTLWRVTDSGTVSLAEGSGGIPFVSGGNLFIYGNIGIYRYDQGSQSLELLYPLPSVFRKSGDALALPDGGVLLAHRDLRDQRLIALNPDGTTRWEYSYSKLMHGQPDLIYHNEHIFMILVGEQNAKARMTLVEIDPLSGQLFHLFDGETRDPVLIDVWVSSDGNDMMLINLGGVLLGFNPLQAQQAISASKTTR